ncbi:hypothetical protein FFI89_023850 [Bradyrhizobium sp. KBS0727]|nr:hypothetical protein FFI71_023855 [Bradyrhizobium sp. KBS0725]QDW46510.1 hypothetical protein FFI89_023850 [Bradyrhizobium sp. KBS0727]
MAHDVERVLANIDADHGECGIGCLRHGVLLVCGAPCQLRLLAGQEHGRTIPLGDLNPPGETAEIPHCSRLLSHRRSAILLAEHRRQVLRVLPVSPKVMKCRDCCSPFQLC